MKFSAELFATVTATLAAGKSLETLAEGAALCGMVSDAETYINAYNTYAADNASSLSRSGVVLATAKVKPSKSKVLLAALAKVAEHNNTHDDAPLCVVVSLTEEGTAAYSVMDRAKPRKRRSKGGSVGSKSRKSAYLIAQGFQKQDDYTVERRGESKQKGGEGYTYLLNGAEVQGSLAQALFALDAPDTHAELRRYHYEPKS